jgi:cobalamin biosynthesis protein CobD/CbiB
MSAWAVMPMISAPMMLAVALAWDLFLGDPPNVIHPVAWMGRLANALVNRAPTTGRLWQLVAGAFIALALEKPGHYRLGHGMRSAMGEDVDRAWGIVRTAGTIMAMLALVTLSGMMAYGI